MTVTRRALLAAAGVATLAVAGCAGDGATPPPAPGPVTALSFPTTPPAQRAREFAEGIESRPVFHHSLRTYLYGRWLGHAQGVEAGRDYDDELLFLGCVLHDVGLTDAGNGAARFDLDGADLAARHLTEQGVATDRVQVVWDAIALHLDPDVAARKRPEIALVSAGAGFDLSGSANALPPGWADRVHAALPRLHAATALRDAIVAQALAKPQKAPPFSLSGELVRQRTGQPWPTWEQLTAGWGD